MPSLYTHYTFAKGFEYLYQYKNVFYLGAQGPDLFYFYGYGAKRKDYKNIRQFGTFLHQNNIGPIYNWMLDYAYNHGGANKEMLLNYIDGLFCHYILDRNTHPYIFFRSGFSFKEDEKGKYFYYHALFETRIDHLIVNEHNTYLKPKTIFKINKKDLMTISRMYYSLAINYLKNQYVKEDTFYLCFKDMIRSTSFLYSKTGIKNKIFKLFVKNSVIYAMSAPKNIDNELKYDYLNLNNREWKFPTTREIKKESFIDLYNYSKEEYLKFIELLKQYKNNDFINYLNQFINNVNHDGFVIGDIKKYFDLSWWGK